MALSVVAASSIGTNNSAVTSLTTSPTYNQAAGNCAVVIVNAFGATIGAVSDTAGNTWTKVFATDLIGTNTNHINAYYAPNCLGNAVNAVKVVVSTSYASVTYWDIAGAALTNPLDVHPDALAGGAGSSVIVLTTTNANDAIISWASDCGAAMTAATQPTGYTKDSFGVIGKYSCGAYTVVSAIQSGVTLTWTYTGSGSGSSGLILAFKAFVVTAPAGPTWMQYGFGF